MIIGSHVSMSGKDMFLNSVNLLLQAVWRLFLKYKHNIYYGYVTGRGEMY